MKSETEFWSQEEEQPILQRAASRWYFAIKLHIAGDSRRALVSYRALATLLAKIFLETHAPKSNRENARKA
jgi:hypothetical protein